MPLQRAAAQNRAGTVISGTYYLEGDSIRVRASVTDARRWQLLAFQGNISRADAVVRGLEHRREALAPFERAVLDRLRAIIAGDRMGALAGARALRRTAAGWSLGYFLQALEGVQANRPRETLEAAAHLSGDSVLIRGGATTGGYPWAAVADARHMLGDFAGELAGARAEQRVFPDRPDGLARELRALAALGRVAELESRLDALEALSTSGGALPPMLSALADELDVHGQADAARRVGVRLLTLPPGDGTAAEDRIERATRAHVLALLGRETVVDTLLAGLAEEAPAEPDYPASRGILAARQGRQADASRAEAQLRASARAYDWGRTPYARAQLAVALGDHDRALALLREALAQGLPYGPALHADAAFAPLRADPRFRELLRPKD